MAVGQCVASSGQQRRPAVHIWRVFVHAHIPSYPPIHPRTHSPPSTCAYSLPLHPTHSPPHHLTHRSTRSHSHPSTRTQHSAKQALKIEEMLNIMCLAVVEDTKTQSVRDTELQRLRTENQGACVCARMSCCPHSVFAWAWACLYWSHLLRFNCSYRVVS